MMTRKLVSSGLAVLTIGGVALGMMGKPATGADIPKSTQQMLKDLKLDAGMLKGLDEALAVPKPLLDAARKEGTVHVAGTYEPRHFRVLVRPFQERYPGIEVNYVRATRYDRVIKAIIALKSGKILFDVIMGFGGQAFQFEKLNALANIGDMPVYSQIPQYMKSPGDLYVGMRILTRCFAYNTQKVKPEDLPKTWDDIVTSKRWAGKNLALINRPNYWALHLWVTKGEDWTKNYLNKLFHEMKPQLRKESVNAAQQLMGAGEFDGLITGTAHQTAVLRKKGSPVGLHCPEPVIPSLATAMGILKGGKVNAGKVFANWFLSREGQMAQYHAARYTPFYPDLRKAGLDSLPDLKLDDSKRLYHREELWRSEYSVLLKHWKNLWLQGQGLKMRTVNVKIDATKRSGRRYHFMVDGKDQKVRISSSDTAITIDGKSAARKAVKKGMTCSITYPGNDETAKQVSCSK